MTDRTRNEREVADGRGGFIAGDHGPANPNERTRITPRRVVITLEVVLNPEYDDIDELRAGEGYIVASIAAAAKRGIEDEVVAGDIIEDVRATSFAITEGGTQ